MASTHLSLLGLVPVGLYDQLVQRLSTCSATGHYYEVDEFVYHRLGASAGGEVSEDNIVRLRATRFSPSPSTNSSSSSVWSLHSLHPPESLRLSPTILSRTIIEAPVSDGDPFALLSALGFTRGEKGKGVTLWMRGVRFVRGGVVVEVYRLFENKDSIRPLDPTSYIVSLSTRSANPSPKPPLPSSSSGGGGPPPSSNPPPSTTTTSSSSVSANNPATTTGGGGGGGASAQELKLEAVARLEEMRMRLRGLVDLGRVEG